MSITINQHLINQILQNKRYHYSVINIESAFLSKGDLKNKLKRGKLCMNNTKVIANSINHHDYRLDNDYINQNEDDTIRSVNFFSKLFMYFG